MCPSKLVQWASRQNNKRYSHHEYYEKAFPIWQLKMSAVKKVHYNIRDLDVGLMATQTVDCHTCVHQDDALHNKYMN